MSVDMLLWPILSFCIAALLCDFAEWSLWFSWSCICSGIVTHALLGAQLMPNFFSRNEERLVALGLSLDESDWTKPKLTRSLHEMHGHWVSYCTGRESLKTTSL
eukprot:TRINITY_DN9926_c1_g2_i1.p1 TRINITY_DN9926_c1_g2~~TRINITY_DN9926_c1_g2_i1.p1  ORF type:complete len:104 (-),score=15.41 TRINITY_DN9926_c1_g2_i1:53-364(-)